MKKYWAQLKPRERTIIAVAGAISSILIIYLALLEPFMLKTEKLTKKIEQQKSQVQWLKSTSAQVKQLQAMGAGASGSASNARKGQSLLVIVDQTAKRGKLGPMVKRVEPDGNNRVRVWLEKAPFDDVAKWLSKLQTKYQLLVDSAVIDKTESKGRVNVRLVFVGENA